MLVHVGGGFRNDGGLYPAGSLADLLVPSFADSRGGGWEVIAWTSHLCKRIFVTGNIMFIEIVNVPVLPLLSS